MEELKSLAYHCHLNEKGAEMAIGGFFFVLKQSKNPDAAEYLTTITNYYNENENENENEDGEEEKDNNNNNNNNNSTISKLIQNYQSMARKDALPKPTPIMFIPRPDFAPPGPPPPVIFKALSKGIRKLFRRDKDGGNTQDVVELLWRKGMAKEDVIHFMKVLIEEIYEKVQVDISGILYLPEKSTTTQGEDETGEEKEKEKGQEAAAAAASGGGDNDKHDGQKKRTE